MIIASKADLPCKGQSRSEIRSWVERASLRAGDRVAVRVGNGGLYDYYLTILVAVDHTRQRRLVVQQQGAFGASFYRDGRNCLHPKGQTYLIEPTAAVMQAAADHVTYHHPPGSFLI